MTRADLSLAAAHQLAGHADGIDQGQRLPALVGGEIDIARTHGEAVRLADDRHADDLHRQVEIGRHPPDDRQLLEILAAEKGDIRLNDVEEFADHRGHAAKMAGPAAAAEGLGQPLDIHIGGITGGIHLPPLPGRK